MEFLQKIFHRKIEKSSEAPDLDQEETEKYSWAQELDQEEVETLRELEMPIEQIFKQLHDEIDAGTYELIVGDDAGGRIPTLMIAGALKVLYAEKNRPAPKVRFMTGSRGTNAADLEKKSAVLKEYMRRAVAELRSKGRLTHDKKALIVTDTIFSGTSVKVIHNIIKKSGLNADIASISVLAAGVANHLKQSLNTKVVYGMEEKPKIDNRWLGSGAKIMTGVYKNYEEPFARPLREKIGTLDLDTPELQKKINAARAFVTESAKRIAEKYKRPYGIPEIEEAA